MRRKVFKLEYELRDHIKSIQFSLEKSEILLRTMKLNISIMARELKAREAEMIEWKKDMAKNDVDAAQRKLDILNGKPVGPKPAKEILCGRKDLSGYQSPCSYTRGHYGVCEGRYDSAMVDRINREKGLV